MKLNTKSLADIELGQPLIAPGTYFFRIEKAEVSPNKARTGNNLVLELRLLDEKVMDWEGVKEIENRGLKYTRYTSLTITDTYDEDAMNRSLKEIAVAIGLPDDADLNVEDIPGKCVKAQVRYREPEGTFSARNEIGKLYPIRPEDNFNEPA